MKHLFLLLILIQFGCPNSSKRPSKVQLEGKKDWYVQSEKLDKYLLDNYKTNEDFTLEYPPDSLSRNIYISIDVTKSGFDNSIRFEGNEVNWSEYNIRKFCQYLLDKKLLQPGDKIKLRIFGSYPNMMETPNRIKRIPQDESIDLLVPKSQIKCKSTILTSRYNDLLLEVSDVEMKVNYDDFIKTKILDWAIDKIKNPHYNKSYLFNHISSVLENANSENSIENIFIFVTDGHIDFENDYFCPSDFSQSLVKQIKTRIETLKLRPFASKTTKVNKNRIILHGLNSSGNIDFKNTQDDLLQWFFEGVGENNLTLIHLGEE